MRRSMIAFFFFGLCACGGSLSKEEREELKKGSESQRIKRVGEADILEQSIQKGRELVILLSPGVTDDKLDSLQEVYHAKINWVEPGVGTGLLLEQQIIDAYVTGAGDESKPDNVQPVGEDSILYTSPAIRELPDGAVEVTGMWSVLFSKPDLVRSMD